MAKRTIEPRQWAQPPRQYLGSPPGDLLLPEEVARWLNGLGAFDADNTRHCLALLALFGIPESYLDVGSGTGVYVNTARKLGVDAWGVDLLPRPDAHLLVRDLRQSLDVGREFTVVTCLEVAEHLPPSSAASLCATLARHVQLGGVLVFTAALPGQQGDGHLTCQPPVYWRWLLSNEGLSYHYGLTLQLAVLWTHMHTPHGYLAADLQVFSKGTPTLPSGAGV